MMRIDCPRRRPGGRRRTGLTLTDVLIGLAMVVFLATLALPALRAAQEQEKRKICADNLRQIAQAALMYATADTRGGGFPRTYYDGSKNVSPTQYTGVDAPKSFTAAAPAEKDVQANDVTAAFYLLIKQQGVDPARFVCPGSAAQPLTFASGGVTGHSNFPSRQYLGYSYNNPYPKQSAIQAGWKFSGVSGPEFPLAGDMNPGVMSVLTTAADAGAEKMKKSNTPNHGGDGQNVVYCDGHVEFQPTPYCGATRTPGGRDNIYAVGAPQKGIPGGLANKGPPEDAQDAVLLPVMSAGLQPGEPVAAAAMPAGGGGSSGAGASSGAGTSGGSGGAKSVATSTGPKIPWLLFGLGGGILLVGAAAGVAMMLSKKKPHPPRRS